MSGFSWEAYSRPPEEDTTGAPVGAGSGDHRSTLAEELLRGIGDPTMTSEGIRSLYADFATGLESVTRAVERTTASATDAAGLVTVTVNAAGVVVSTEFDPERIRGARADALGRAVTEAARSAASRVHAAVTELTAPVTDVESALAELTGDGHTGHEDLARQTRSSMDRFYEPPTADDITDPGPARGRRDNTHRKDMP